MKKILFSKWALTLGLFTAALAADAQVAQPLSSGALRANLMNARMKVNSPAAIAGLKKVTLATWGGQLSTPLTNIQVVRGLDSLAMNPLTNGSQLAGKFALLFRGGGVTFYQKANYALQAGAIGVIIVNNIPGDPIAMGNAGSGNVSIPALMVTDIEGNAMNNQLRNGATVTITLGSWNLGATHDLGLVEGFQGTPHALNVPLSMFAKSGNKTPYKQWIGGAVANFGTATESNINVLDSLTWTPTGGATTPVSQHSYTVPNIAPLDSIKFGFGNAASSYFITPPATTGRYDFKYRLTYGNTDEVPEDNSYTMSMYVNDSIFCKSHYDYATRKPHVTQGIQPASAANPFLMGPMFFVTDGGHAARHLQFYLSKNGVDFLDGSEVFALIYKWEDGINGEALDSFVVGGELTLVGQTYNMFGGADSSGKVYSLPITNPNNPNQGVVLDSNSWYWVCLQSPPDCFIGVDESISYFTRSYTQSQQTGYHDYPEGFFGNDLNGLTTNNVVFNFPFGGNALNVDSTFYDRYNQIPALALHISKNKESTPTVGIARTTKLPGQLVLFPNPAQSTLTVDLKLDQQSAKVGLRLLDVVGRLVYAENHSNVKNGQYSINVSKLPAGTYHLFVTTDNGYMSKQVVIQH